MGCKPGPLLSVPAPVLYSSLDSLLDSLCPLGLGTLISLAQFLLKAEDQKVMMAGNLTNNQQKWILKQYWKTENAKKVRQKRAEELDTPSPSRQIIYRICDTFDEMVPL